MRLGYTLTAAHSEGIVLCTEASIEGLKRNQLPVTVGDGSFGLTEHILTGLVVTPTYLLTHSLTHSLTHLLTHLLNYLLT